MPNNGPENMEILESTDIAEATPANVKPGKLSLPEGVDDILEKMEGNAA